MATLEERLAQAVEVWSVKVEGQMRGMLEGAGKVVTGRLVDNIRVIANAEDSKVTASVSFTEYGNYVISGRAPGGRMPPLSAIASWASMVGLPSSAVFPIAKSIAVRGIRPFDFTVAFDEGLPELTEEVARITAEWALEEIKNSLDD